MNNEQNRAIAVAHEIQKTVNTVGWNCAMDVAERAVQEAEQKALRCAEDNQIVGLQRKAQASREFLEKFQQLIQVAMNPQIARTADDFIPVACD